MAHVSHTENVYQRARQIIASKNVTGVEARDVVRELLRRDEFRWAGAVIERMFETMDPALMPDMVLRWAICTSRDPEIVTAEAIRTALEIIHRHCYLASTNDQEVLGLAGALYKRYWEATRERRYLIDAVNYFRRGYMISPGGDLGYNGTNLAFLLDLLASMDQNGLEETDVNAAPPSTLRTEANTVREVLSAQLMEVLKTRPDEENSFWFVSMLAEVYFGNGLYPEAKIWLSRAKQLNFAHWPVRSVVTHLAQLYALQHGRSLLSGANDDGALDALDNLIGRKGGCREILNGKMGLALSGGGFRASFFHLGVLAKLSELDLLRRVEVLSCVSGGSIAGAQYYLQLREILQTINVESLDEEQLRDLYIDLVRKVSENFLAGVQTNIRMRVFANPIPLLRTIVDPTYSCTVRMGELLEKHLFARAWADKSKDIPHNNTVRSLNLCDLQILPYGGVSASSDQENAFRKAKIPKLVINATTLNTGNNWQFTVDSIGESPTSVNLDANNRNRLRRVPAEVYSSESKILLSRAVAASACVPGLFEPIRIDGLYPKPYVLRLIDGGVQDNQGLASLIEANCEFIFASDASGQIATEPDPGGGILSSVFRSSSSMMERVREGQYRQIDLRRSLGFFKDIILINLKKELDFDVIDYVGYNGPPPPHLRAVAPVTSYGIPKEIQERLAMIRTDLDSFSEVEAFALMISGYRMAGKSISKDGMSQSGKVLDVDWPFLKIEPFMTDKRDPSYRRLVALLGTGRNRLFRAYRQSTFMRVSSAPVLVLGLYILLTFLSRLEFVKVELRLSGILALLGAFVSLLVPKVRQHGERIGMALLGLVLWLPVWIHLLFIDPLFIKNGRVGRL
jgi:predicted acylesterase/phospholipase RssA